MGPNRPSFAGPGYANTRPTFDERPVNEYTYVDYPSLRQNIPGASQPGPGYTQQPQMMVAQHQPAGPHLPSVGTYGGFAGAPAPALPPGGYTWRSHDGWTYQIQSNAYVTVIDDPTGQFRGRRQTPGTSGHKAIIQQWIQEHATSLTNTSVGMFFLAQNQQYTSSSGLLAKAGSAISDMIYTATSGAMGTSSSAQPAPTIPTPNAPVQHAVDTNTGALVPVPDAPAGGGSGSGITPLKVIGLLLVVGGLAGGAYWMFGDKKVAPVEARANKAASAEACANKKRRNPLSDTTPNADAFDGDDVAAE